MTTGGGRIFLLALPAGIVFAAFFLVPLGVLFVIGGTGKEGWGAYLAILGDRVYFSSLVSTTLLSAAVTAATLAISGTDGHRGAVRRCADLHAAGRQGPRVGLRVGVAVRPHLLLALDTGDA